MIAATCRARILDLHASMQEPIIELMTLAQVMLDKAQWDAWRVKIGSTFRRPDAQLKLYMQGRIKLPDGNWKVDPKGRVVTHALPHQTPHCVVDRGGNPAALAADIWIVNAVSGELAPDDNLVWAIVPAAAFRASPGFFASGAFFKSLRDWPHVERRGWKDLATNGVLKGATL